MLNKSFKHIALVVAALLSGVAAAAQQASATWTVEAQAGPTEGSYILSFSGAIAPLYHIYGPEDPTNPFEVELRDATALGAVQSALEATPADGRPSFSGKALFTQEVKADGSSVSGTLTWQGCKGKVCDFPETYDFTVELPGAEAHESAIEDPEAASDQDGSLWALILEAILWGFAMLLTPCVFPMVPMTVSFFLKGEGNGRFKAFMYGLFIVLLYTVPISVIIGLTRLIGGEAVTADIFNWLATHWLPNLLFFLVFFVFALSFFGAFEITLPASWTTSTDAKSGKKGLAGVFFMALTLVLVSFSCTGPIVGSVLIKSTQGEFWTPMVTMLAFSVAFALPFTTLALFPGLLKKMKSGSWLGSVKVVLGFVELALGLKFLSTADQTYHWHLLDREVYLALWIAIFTLLGLYLLRIIRFKDEQPHGQVSIVRLMLSIGVFSFVMYLIPGMWGAPLKALSGYLPPMETQDFVLGAGGAQAPLKADEKAAPYDLTLPLGLSGYFSLEEGLAAAKASGKPVFLDITGHGCVNCREMEARVWSDPQVLQRLKTRFEVVALYTDDKTRLPESEWVTTPGGKTLKTLGAVNAYYVRSRFQLNSQPNYLILSPEGEILAGPRAYNLSIPAYIDFLDSAL
ncbi:MAG: thioredoxin family protein [Bacteroidales bacterium]|nr:thioredoxin family protein [Bacteroidales bacterium]